MSQWFLFTKRQYTDCHDTCVYCKYTLTVQAQNTIIVLVKTSKRPCSPYGLIRETYTILAQL